MKVSRAVSPVALAALILALALLEWDLLSGFLRLFAWQCALLMGLAILLQLSWRSSRRAPQPTRRLLTFATVLVFLLAALALAHHLQAYRTASSWEEQRSTRLEQRAQGIRRDFAQLLGELSAPAADLARVPAGDRRALFQVLEAAASRPRPEGDRFGWTLWNREGPIAWGGRTALAAAPASRGGASIFAQGASQILASSTPVGSDAFLLGEYLLQSPLEEEPRLPLHRPAVRGGSVTLRIAAPVRPSEESDLASSRLGRARHGALPASTNLFVPLQGATGRTLVVVSLSDQQLDEVLLQDRRNHWIAGVLLNAAGLLLLALLCFAGRKEGRMAWVLSGAGFLVAARAALLPLSYGLSGSSLFDPRLFGSMLAEPLFRSAGDFFLTSVVWLLLVTELTRSRWDPEIPPRPLRIAAGVLLLVPSGYLLGRLAAETPWHARFDVTRVELFPINAPRLLVQTGLLMLFGGWLLLALSWGSEIRRAAFPRASRNPVRLPTAARAIAFVTLTVFLFLPILLASSLRQRESFFLDTLLPEVENQTSIREQILKEAIDRLDQSPRARRILASASGAAGEGTAYRLWSLTRLKEEGLSSSLRLFAPDGTPIGRFGLNLPAEAKVQELLSQGPGHPKRLVLRVGGLKRRVLEAETLLKAPGIAPHRVQIYLVDEAENLSVLRAGNPYARVFQVSQTGETNPELIGSEPLLALLDEAGRIQECNLENAPVFPPGFLERLPAGRPRWIQARIGVEDFRVIAKRSSGKVLAMGFLLPSALRLTGSFTRMILMGLLLGLILATVLGMLGGMTLPQLRPRGGLFRRLLAVFLAASFLPLFALAFFLQRFAAREFEENLLSQGISSLGAAGRIVEDYLSGDTQEEAAPPIEDGVAYWISRVVHQDISLYRGDVLSATSTRELFASGLLPTRLEAPLYRQLLLEGQPYALGRQQVGNLSTLVIAAPLSLGNPAAGVLSLPLSGKEMEIRHKRADVEEAILIVTVLMLLLLTLLSDILARRVARPISALAAATERIEAGDYDAEVRLRTRDEPAMLIDSFNRMAASLRRQREDLRRRSDYIRKILLHATTGVVSTDAQERIVTVNPAARLLLGLPSTPAPGSDLIETLSSEPALAPLRDALASTPADREARWQIELRWEDRPATLRVASLPFRASPSAPPGRILLFEDLTETVRSSRLQAWAEMARTIAHEIKNPLTPIQLSADHLRKVYLAKAPDFGDILEECLDTIQKQVLALRRIAADFSDYARIPNPKPQRIAPAQLLEEVLAPYRDFPPSGTTLELRIDAGTPDLWADPVLTRRALANLVQNALEAMTEGGTLSILAGIAPDGAGLPSQRVRIRVKDTGPGIDPAARARLFEPYFSTKASGSGLGLSIVRKSTEEQGGRVQIHSAPGKGTEVLLDLPAWSPVPQSSADSAPEGAIR